MPQQTIPSRLRRQLLRVLADAFPDTPQQQSARGAYLSQSARVADKKDIGAKTSSGTCTAKPDLIVTGRKRDWLLHARRQAHRFKVDDGPSTIGERNELPIQEIKGNLKFARKTASFRTISIRIALYPITYPINFIVAFYKFSFTFS